MDIVKSRALLRVAAIVLFLLVGGVSLYARLSPIWFGIVGWALVAFLLAPPLSELRALVNRIRGRGVIE